PARLPALIEVLGATLGNLRPWRLRAAPATDDDGSRRLHVELAGVALRLNVRDCAAHLRLTLYSPDGELRLIDPHGPVRWTPRDGEWPLDLGDRTPADALADWADAVGADLRELLAALERRDPALPGDLPQRLALAQLLEDLRAVLGDAAPASATADVDDEPVEATRLQAAAVAVDDSDSRADTLADSISADAIHAAGLRALHARLPGGAAALEGCAELLRELDAISLAAQARVLHESKALGDDEARDGDALAAATGTAPRHRWLLNRWLAALVDSGALQRDGERYRWLRRPPLAMPAAVAPRLSAIYAQLGFPPAMARFHNAALARLETLLHDGVQIQDLLFEDADPIAALAAYQDNPFTAYANAAAAELLRRCPARGARLRAIELGAGPGLSADAALAALEGRDIDYLFSDISRMFVVAAQQRHAERAGLRYGLLDIDRDFAAQGIAPRSADAIVAGNVLHNAAHIGRSLRHIHRSLAPGGWLVFTESTADNRAVLTSMQFLLSPRPGAQLPGHSDRRSNTAGGATVFLDASGWNEELVAAGFRPRLVLPADPQSAPAAAGQCLFFATACP
ncbi:bifunctional Gfo/Idh/MocA family oxidoreductase/class I SAM-dependent methyltransferase, partial [Pseudomonas sp. CGJS7]|uniref:bifunctional Gfo/Idh/MocA family oxidoreductase/class I SAM-dependent methyltransferase n=1 Tax=Pseudomonas sp. CGJS7 TaxID=3109348 RepID=UPI00300808E1